MSRRERQQRRRRNTGGPTRVLFLALGLLITGAAIAAVAVVGWIISVAESGPELSELKLQDVGSTSVVYASDGTTRLGTIQANVLRIPLTSDSIPDVMREATVAIEDRRFYVHRGVDYEGIVRAAVKNLESDDKGIQGGSTLTMQLIRNLYTQDDTRTGIEGYKRKIREAKLANELEDVHPGREGKAWILNKYLNNVPYGTVGGQTSVGVQAAARTFFGKPAKDLNLQEAALLAGLPQAPSQYNPFQNAEGAKARRDQVLRQMAAERYITDAQKRKAIAAPLGVKHSSFYTARREQAFFDYVKAQLIEEYGLQRVQQGGMRVYTTLDLKLQQAARKALADGVSADRSGAIVSVDPRNGEIKAMASTAKYGEFKFNLASQGKYAAGSTFKTMVLMEALRRGVDPRSTTYDSRPLKFDDPVWGPIDVQTYSNTYLGRQNLVRATLASDNSIYMQLDLDLGPVAVKDTAVQMGIKTKLDGYPSEGLGGLTRGVSPLEMANAYATIASGGWRNRVTALKKVCFPGTSTARYTCKDLRAHRHKAFQDGVTYEVTKILEQNVQGGTGTAAQIGCPAAGKTGTTDDFTDAWFVGYTPRLSTAVWVGHATDRRTLGYGAAGGEVAAPIWGRYMKTGKGSFCGGFPQPKEPFVAKPFDGKYSKVGVKDNEAGDFKVDQGGARDLETGTGGTRADDTAGDTTGGDGGTATPAPTPTQPAATPPATPAPDPAAQAPAPAPDPNAAAPDGGTAAPTP